MIETDPTSPSFLPDIKIDRGEPSNIFFRIYTSPKLDPIGRGTPPSDCDNFPYEIGSVYSGKYAFESSVRELIEQYNENYSAVKENLDISPSNDFSFSLKLSDGTIIEATQEINTKNIYAQETPIQYIDEDANIKSGYLTTKLW